MRVRGCCMKSTPVRRALHREAALAGELMGAGVTALGRACTAKIAYYPVAFFDLSQGIERAAKLVIVADYMIKHNGALPRDRTLKKTGHKLKELLASVEEITYRTRPGTKYIGRPADDIHCGIVDILDELATVNRYYNLDLLSGHVPNQQIQDPVIAWHTKVGTPILQSHYDDRQQARTEERASMMSGMMDDILFVLRQTEDGSPINDVNSMTVHNDKEAIVQRRGQFYTLQILRWIASTIQSMAFHGVYKLRIEGLLGLDEFFDRFVQEDRLLKSRRTWSIYSW
jgi:hypothetical protein